MGSSIKLQQQANDQSVYLDHLRAQQKSLTENSKEWFAIQEKLNHIYAQRFLEYVNT